MNLRWGILGCARISRRGLIPGIQASKTGRLVALASRNPGTARAWCDEFKIFKRHESYQGLLEDPEIDAVYIPLPNELHKPWVVAAADAGKHVLCEKPLALNAVKAREMVEQCRSRGVLLMEAFMWRHQPRTHELRACCRRLARRTTLDPVVILVSHRARRDWRLDPARGGGALWDVGCYGISTARFFAGAEPESVRARARFGPTGVDLTLTASLGFPNGVLASIDCSYLPPAKRKPIARLRTIGSASDSDAGTDLIKNLEFEMADQQEAMIDAFATSVAAGGLVEPAEDGLARMKALDAILEAARS